MPGIPSGFRFCSNLARTPSSDVHLVVHPALGPEPVVLKVLRLDGDVESRRLFVQGNELARQLDHPNVIAVLATGDLPDGSPWVALPHLEGGSLGDRCRHGPPLAPAQVVHIGVRIADVLHLLHSVAGAVHRDVKPDNILLGADGEPVLADLNVAGRFHLDTGSLTTDRRSLRYSAPEVREFGRYSVQSELFSLGATMIEMFTGVPAFERRPGESLTAFRQRWDAGALPVELAAVCPPQALVVLLRRMLAPERTHRPSSAAEVAAALRGLQAETGLPVTSPTPALRRRQDLLVLDEHVAGAAGRIGRRRLLMLAGAAGVTAIGGGGFLAWPRAVADPGEPGPAATGDGERRSRAVQVGLDLPWGIAVDATGSTLLVADSNNLVVRRRRLDSEAVDAVAADVSFRYPCGLAFRRDGSFYIADSVLHQVFLVQIDGTTSVVAGSGQPGFSGDGGPGADARLQGPHGLAVAANGDLYIADTDNNRIRRLDTDGLITTVAGTGAGSGFRGDGGSAGEATIAGPEGLVFDQAGSLYVTQWRDCLIRRIDPSGRIVAVAGTGGPGYGGDGGPAVDARLNGPGGPSIGPTGELIFSDLNNNRVRRIGPDGVISTLAGSGQRGESVAGALATDASLANPIGTAVGPDGEVYVLELINSRVLQILDDGTLAVVLE